MQTVNIEAPAKVNLTLLVTGKRQDGFHNLATLFVPLELHDEITIEIRQDRDIIVNSNLSYIPRDMDNLAGRAASLFFERFGINGGVEVTINKRIPVGGGLGGGSSDAAAVLLALARIYDIDIEQLFETALEIGSDVPFFLLNSWAIGRGRGELLTAIPGISAVPMLLAKPSFGVSTPRVYAELRPNEHSPNEKPLLDLIEALDAPISDWWQLTKNDLETPAIRVAPELQMLKNRFSDAGFSGMVSGSGGTVFCPIEDTTEAQLLVQELIVDGYWALVTQTA